jgi:signal transduction histidine kinase
MNKQCNDLLDDKGKIYCAQILKLSEHIANLVEQINLFISTKETPLSFEPLRLKEILRMLKDEFSARLSIRQITWIEPDEEVSFNADRVSILRVFRNLIDNALKYGGDKLSTIWIGYEESEDAHIFSVSNDGKVLKLPDSEKLFGPFQRHEPKGIEGVGLGLAIVKEITEKHGGKVWVGPGPGNRKGITFNISINKNQQNM